MELQEALTQITAIRLQIARSETYQGYRPLPVAFSGLLAFLAAALQQTTLSHPTQQLGTYLAIWMTMAALSVLVAGVEIMQRSRHSTLSLARETNRLVVGQFLPCLVAGGLVTVVIVYRLPEVALMLPGLWQIFFSLGIFASYRLWPRGIFLVGVFYMGTGLICLGAEKEAALSPWTMGLPFGVGQLLAAGILYRSLRTQVGSSAAPPGGRDREPTSENVL